MPSNKKKKKHRGRPPPQARPTARNGVLDLQQKLLRHRAALPSLPPASVVEDVRRGMNIPTQAIVQLSWTIRGEKDCLRRLVEAGILEAVSGLLERCVDEEFADVLADVGAGEGCEFGGVGLPSVWINVLVNILCDDGLCGDASRMDECRLIIAKSIGPLVRCMVDDARREFFKDNSLWHGAISFFMTLLRNLTLTLETVPILLQYDGLADMVIQSIFWGTHRSDIVVESKSHGAFVTPNNFSEIAHAAGFVVMEMADVINKEGKFDEKGTERLDFLARTPTVSNAYDSDARTTFAVGLTQLLGTETATVQKDHLFWVLNQFTFAGIVDSHVIEGLVTYGIKMKDSEDIQPVVKALFNIVSTNSERRGGHCPPTPNDSRYAIAIKNGLLQMILRILQRFRFNVADCRIDIIKNLVNGASSVALMKRSSKAIQSCRDKVLTELKMVNQYANIGQKSLRVVEAIRSIINQSIHVDTEFEGAITCRRCYKMLEVKDRKVCTRCKRAIYCSRDCQAQDWKNGHKRDCKHMAVHAEQVKMAGNCKKDAKKAELHEDNVSKIGNKVFYDNLHPIMLRAIFEGLSIIECIVIIGFLDAPPRIELKPAAAFLGECKEKNPKDYAHTKHVVEQNRSSGNLTVGCHSLDAIGETDVNGHPATAFLLKTFPGTGAPFGSWEVYQKSMEEDMPDEYLIYRKNKDLREDFLREMSKF